MDVVKALQASGFAHVIVLDAVPCGVIDAPTLILALWPYQAEAAPDTCEAWIHPYYFASQQAYDAAESVAKADSDHTLTLRDDDVLVKPVFSRLPIFRQGRNTLSYVEGLGSRFHVQLMTSSIPLQPTHCLEDAPHALHCGSCQACVRACPTNALEGCVFHRERCIRNWQLSGQPIPEEIRQAMSNTLVGCDICQRVCPHNAKPEGENTPAIALETILTQHKDVANALRKTIGVNLAYGNRILAQGCLIAGCCHRADQLPHLRAILENQMLLEHPSEAVVEHALWAIEEIEQSE